jgi:hypothetical protein
MSSSRDPLAVNAMTVGNDDRLSVDLKGTCAAQASSISHSIASKGYAERECAFANGGARLFTRRTKMGKI